jgi:hydrogenase nickel incorporation protein HypA/HybF
MHERSLVAGLLDQIVREIAPRDPRRVQAVTLEIGEFAGVEPLLLASAFEELAPTVLSPEVRLDWRTVPLRACCESCVQEFSVSQFRFVCPACGASRVRVVAGEELLLVSVELTATEPRITKAIA